MRIKWKPFWFSILLPLAVGALSALVTGNSMKTFQTLHKPPFSPPGWLFPIVWTVLYILMGLASYLTAMSHRPMQEIQRAWKWYGIQLIINFFWPVLFFRFGWRWFSFFWLLILGGVLIKTGILFYRISKKAGILLLPYFLWLVYAGYLNFLFALKN